MGKLSFKTDGVGKMAPWVREIAEGPDDLNSIPETHKMEGDDLQISACRHPCTNKRGESILVFPLNISRIMS